MTSFAKWLFARNAKSVAISCRANRWPIVRQTVSRQMSSLLLSFGVITDVQYADSEDRPAAYDPNKTRYYRHALEQVDRAFARWTSTATPVSFALQLGDIIDGINKKYCRDGGSSLRALSRTLERFELNTAIPTFHAVGNHELYNFQRRELAQLFRDSLSRRCLSDTGLIGLNSLELTAESLLRSADELMLYYTFRHDSGVKFISLDCFDVSVLGSDTGHPNYSEAADILAAHHGHHDWDGWDSDDQLSGADKRFQSSNGALSDAQLQWLDEELSESDASGELVVVFGHVGLHPDSCGWDCIMWNYDAVIACFNRHPSVVAYLSGHAHNGGYAQANGVHYVVFQAVIETEPETESFATIHVYNDRLEIVGHGSERSRTLAIENRRDLIRMESSGDEPIMAETVAEEMAHEEVTVAIAVEVEV